MTKVFIEKTFIDFYVEFRSAKWLTSDDLSLEMVILVFLTGHYREPPYYRVPLDTLEIFRKKLHNKGESHIVKKVGKQAPPVLEWLRILCLGVWLKMKC